MVGAKRDSKQWTITVLTDRSWQKRKLRGTKRLMGDRGKTRKKVETAALSGKTGLKVRTSTGVAQWVRGGPNRATLVHRKSHWKCGKLPGEKLIIWISWNKRWARRQNTKQMCWLPWAPTNLAVSIKHNDICRGTVIKRHADWAELPERDEFMRLKAVHRKNPSSTFERASPIPLKAASCARARKIKLQAPQIM